MEILWCIGECSLYLHGINSNYYLYRDPPRVKFSECVYDWNTKRKKKTLLEGFLLCITKLEEPVYIYPRYIKRHC